MGASNYCQEMGLYAKIQVLATGDVKHGGKNAFSMKTADGLLAGGQSNLDFRRFSEAAASPRHTWIIEPDSTFS